MKMAAGIFAVVMIVLGVFFSIEHFLDPEHYNHGFNDYPLIISLHVAGGGLYFLGAALQFIPAIRRSRPIVHRITGRITFTLGLASGVVVLAITWLFPFSGMIEFYAILPFTGWFLWSLWQGFQAARAKDFTVHRKWMIRAFALASGIVTMRLIFVPLLIITDADEALAATLSLFSFVSAFLIHIALAEWWLRRHPVSQPAPAS